MEKKLYSLQKGLKKARKNKGWKQDDLAKEMSVSLKTVMNWEQGRVNPPLETMMELSEVLDCDLDYLTGRLEEKTHDLHSVHEFTGLSEKALEKIICPELNHPMSKTLSRMIESERFENLLTTFSMFLAYLDKLKVSDLDDQQPWAELNENGVVLGINHATTYCKQEVSFAAAALCEHEYSRKASQLIQGMEKPFSISFEGGKMVIHEEGDEREE